MHQRVGVDLAEVLAFDTLLARENRHGHQQDQQAGRPDQAGRSAYLGGGAEALVGWAGTRSKRLTVQARATRPASKPAKAAGYWSNA